MPEENNIKTQNELDKIFNLNLKFEKLQYDASFRLANYRHYYQHFHGRTAGLLNLPAGRARKVTNWEQRLVRMMANFTMPNLPEIHCPRDTEIMPEGDANQEIPDIGMEFDASELKEKVLRQQLNYKKQGKRELKRGLVTGLANGDTAIYHPWDDTEKIFKIQNVFPGYIRIKFKDNNYDEIEHFFVCWIKSTNEIKQMYGKDVGATRYEDIQNPASIWDSYLLNTGDYAVVKIYFDGEKEVHYSGQQILKEKINTTGEIPLTWIPAMVDPFSPHGISYLKDLIPIIQEHNEVNSDEEAITKLFSRPKVIIRNATQKDIDNIKKMWKKGIVASKGNLEVQPFEFKNNIFPIEKRKENVEQRLYQISGIGPAVFGMPMGSINTGASLTVQYAPTLQMAQIIWESWEPKLMMMFESMLKILEKKGGKFENRTYKEIINGNYEVELQTPFKVPREESVHVSNVINKLQSGIISKTTAMVELGIDSPQDELMLQAWERFHPLLNPGQEQDPKMTPQQGADRGGRMRANQATNQALGGGPAAERPQAGFRGSAPTR